MITPEDLEKTKRLAEAATPGPWDSVDGECPECNAWGAITLFNSLGLNKWVDSSDKEFIAHVHPQRVLAMVAAIERLKDNLNTAFADLIKERSELQAAKAEIQDLKAAMEDRDEMHAQQVQTLDADRLRTRRLLEEAQVALAKIAGGRTTAIEGDPRGICWEHQIIAHEALIKLRAERGWK